MGSLPKPLNKNKKFRKIKKRQNSSGLTQANETNVLELGVGEMSPSKVSLFNAEGTTNLKLDGGGNSAINPSPPQTQEPAKRICGPTRSGGTPGAALMPLKHRG
jgi:hypothetical protein